MARGKDPETVSLSRLRTQALSGDGAALNRFLEMAHTILMRDLATQRPPLVQRGLLEDAVQEGMLRIFGHLREVRSASEGGLIRWMLAIGRNVGLDLLRATSDRHTVGLLEEHDGAPEEDQEDDGAGPVPHELFYRILASLSESEHRLLWLRLVRGDPWVWVGREMGISSDAARVRFQRLSRRLRQRIEAWVDELGEPARTTLRLRLGLEDEVV